MRNHAGTNRECTAVGLSTAEFAAVLLGHGRLAVLSLLYTCSHASPLPTLTTGRLQLHLYSYLQLRYCCLLDTVPPLTLPMHPKQPVAYPRQFHRMTILLNH